MEMMRTDTTFRLLGLSRNGWISLAAVLFGIGLLWWMQRRGEPRVLVGPPVFIAPGAETVDSAGDLYEAIASNNDGDDSTDAANPPPN